MKIAMLTNNYKPFVGGVPISVERLAKELRKQGHKVTVFAPDYGFDPRYGAGGRGRCHPVSGDASEDGKRHGISEAGQQRNLERI